jgi:hypothetical protein
MQEAMPGIPGWLLLLVAMIISCVVAAALNFVIEKVAYRPLRNSPKLAPLITAIGMSILLQTLAMIIFKPNYKPYPTLLPAAPIQFGGAVITPTQIMILGLTAVSLAVLMYLVNYTAGPRDAGHRGEPARGGPDGREARHGDLGHLRHRRGAGHHRRHHVRVQLRHGAAHHGLPAGAQGLHGGGVRRHRQPGRRGGRRHPAGADRVHRLGLHRRRSPAACWAATTATSSPSSS